MNLRIIDVSTWQKTIDWEKLQPEIDGAIIRCGYGSDVESQDDKYFKTNADECTRLGIPFGVYLYSYATNETKAKSEAEHILRLIAPYKLSYPVYLDCEEETADIRAYAKTACEIVGEIIENAGYTFGVYANLNWWNNYLKNLDQYTKWVAQYSSACQYAKPFDMWQFTSSKTVSGISGGVDFNECYVDFPSIINGENTEIEDVEDTPTLKSNEEIAQEIWQGLWGEGTERKKNLTEAGYDYDAIQVIVNSTSPEDVTISVGDKVKIMTNATSYDSVKLASFVYNNTYTVDALSGDRAVLDKSGICTAVNINDLEKV